MKYLFIFLSVLFLFSCEDEEDFSQPFYEDENGVTIKAKDWVTVGTTSDLNGVTYIAVDSLMLCEWIDSGKDYGKVVTTLVTGFRPMLISYNATNRGIEFPVKSITYNIETWDVSNIKIYDCPFYATAIDQDLSGWDLSNVTSLSLCGDLNNIDPKINNWNISNVNELGQTFLQGNYVEGIDLSNWDVSNVTDCSRFSLTSDWPESRNPNFLINCN
jgi:surface protein